MKKTSTWFVSTCLTAWVAISFTAATVFAQLPDTAKPGPQAPTNSMMAGSPISAYTSSIMLDMVVIGVLVSILLIGGMVVINLTFLSKREIDRTGYREPSDSGILGGTLWPKQKQVHPVLPAEEDVDQFVADSTHPHSYENSSTILTDESQMISALPGSKRPRRNKAA